MNVVSKQSWAKSHAGQPIALHLSSEQPMDPILLIGGVHGDEPEGVWLAEACLAWLTENSDLSILRPWMLIPCLNPDGFSKGTRVNQNGVDLNRNYPSRNWSPNYEDSRYFPGSEPGSEIEIKSLVQLISQSKPRLIIHCHSWNPCIVFTGEPAKPPAEALGACSGYRVTNDIGYPTPGSLSQYGWVDNKIPIICIEEEEHTPKERIWPHFLQGFKKIFLKNEQEIF